MTARPATSPVTSPTTSRGTREEANHYLTALLKVDVLIATARPEPSGASGSASTQRPDGLDPQAVRLAERWFKAFTSGSWFMVREHMRTHLDDHRDPSATFADCIDEMGSVLAAMEGLTHDDLVEVAAAIRAIQDREVRLVNGGDPADEAAAPLSAPTVESDQDTAKRALEIHLAQVAIDDLRTGLPTMPWWEPNGPRDRFWVFAADWATYIRTCLARQIGGAAGEAAAAEVSDPPLSAAEALAGLHDAHRRLAEMTPRHRTIAFAAMDWVWEQPSATNNWQFDPANS